jgi:hypothetical protein
VGQGEQQLQRARFPLADDRGVRDDDADQRDEQARDAGQRLEERVGVQLVPDLLGGPGLRLVAPLGGGVERRLELVGEEERRGREEDDEDRRQQQQAARADGVVEVLARDGLHGARVEPLARDVRVDAVGSAPAAAVARPSGVAAPAARVSATVSAARVPAARVVAHAWASPSV